MASTKRIIIAGGGTGGHIFPALAIAQALKRKDPALDLLFVGARGRMEMQKIPEAGFRIEGIDIAGFNRSSLIKNISLPLKLVKSFFQVRQIFRSFRPDAVLGVGGYSSFPVLRYAEARGIPAFIHESNSFAGRANMMLAKKAARIFVASDGMEKFFPAAKILVTGNPVRKNISAAQPDSHAAREFFGLDAAKKTLLAVGGSLGARSLNEAMQQGLGQLLGAGLQVIWQTGKSFGEEATRRAGQEKGVWAGEFIGRMDLAFAAADIVVSRAGAMTIAELCVVGKAVIFVPYPHAAEDHQTANARNLVNKGAGILIRDESAAKDLVPAVLELAGDENKRRSLSENIKKLAATNADDLIAEEILQAIS